MIGTIGGDIAGSRFEWHNRKLQGRTPKTLGFFEIFGFGLATRQLRCSSEGAGAVRLARLVLPPMSSGRSYHAFI